MTLCLVLGGARSGKSAYAQTAALEHSSRPVYVATSRPVDSDHQQRIRRHQQDRGSQWRTLEIDLDLAAAPLRDEVVVVDCITLWLSNYFADNGSSVDDCLRWAAGQVDSIAAGVGSGRVFLVSNELGQGVHASTRLGRRFVDLQGLVNQHIAQAAQSVVLMVAGLPLAVKGSLPHGG